MVKLSNVKTFNSLFYLIKILEHANATFSSETFSPSGIASLLCDMTMLGCGLCCLLS